MKNYPANIKLAGGLALTLLFATAQEAAPSGSVKAEGKSGIMADQKQDQKKYPPKAFVRERVVAVGDLPRPPNDTRQHNEDYIERDIDETPVDLVFYTIKKLEQGAVYPDTIQTPRHWVNVDPFDPKSGKEFTKDGRMLAVAYVKKGSAKDGRVDPDDIYEPWKNGKKNISEDEADRVYYVPDLDEGEILGKAIDPDAHKVVDVSPRGTPSKNLINKLFVDGQEVRSTFVRAGTTKIGEDVKRENVYDLRAQGYRYKDNPRLLESISQEPAPRAPTPKEEFNKVAAPVVAAERNWKAAWRNLGEIKTALESDVKAQKPETQARLKELVGDDKYSGVLKNYIEVSVARGSPSYDKDHQFMIMQVRDGKEVSFQAAAPKPPEPEPVAVEKPPEKPPSVSPPVKSQLAILSEISMKGMMPPPDLPPGTDNRRKLLGYENGLEKSAKRTADEIASGGINGEQAELVIAAHEKVPSGYGPVLREAWTKFQDGKGTSADREGLFAKIGEVKSGRVDVANSIPSKSDKALAQALVNIDKKMGAIKDKINADPDLTSEEKKTAMAQIDERAKNFTGDMQKMRGNMFRGALKESGLLPGDAKPTKLSQDEMRDLLPPDPKSLADSIHGRLSYEEIMYQGARGAIQRMASGKIPPDQLKQVIDEHKRASTGYAEILEAASNELGKYKTPRTDKYFARIEEISGKRIEAFAANELSLTGQKNETPKQIMERLSPPDPKDQQALHDRARDTMLYMAAGKMPEAVAKDLTGKYKQVSPEYGKILEATMQDFKGAANKPQRLWDALEAVDVTMYQDEFNDDGPGAEEYEQGVHKTPQAPAPEVAWQEKIALRPEMMAGFLIPDRKLFPLTGQGEKDYEERLRSNAAGAVIFMSSGQMYPKDAEKVIEVHKYAKSGYGDILEKAWQEFKDTKRETPGDPSKYLEQINEIKDDHVKEINAEPRSEVLGAGSPVAAKDKLVETSIETAFGPLSPIFARAHDYSYEPTVEPKVDYDHTLVATVTADMPKNA